MSSTVLDLVEEANVPAVDVAPAGNVPLAGAFSPDDLTAAVMSAMTLFGRCHIRRVTTNTQFSNGRWVAP